MANSCLDQLFVGPLLVMDSPPHPPSESETDGVMMDNQSSTTSLIIAHFLGPDSEGGCGGESITKVSRECWSKKWGPKLSIKKWEFHYLITLTAGDQNRRTYSIFQTLDRIETVIKNRGLRKSLIWTSQMNQRGAGKASPLVHLWCPNEGQKHPQRQKTLFFPTKMHDFGGAVEL